MLAAIRIRGGVRIERSIKDTFTMLNLTNQHNLILLPETSANIGMLKKVKDYITWGEVDEAFAKELQAKLPEGQKVIRLHPPRGGFERKGIKAPFTTGGVLGYRGEKIADLIKKMSV